MKSKDTESISVNGWDEEEIVEWLMTAQFCEYTKFCDYNELIS